MIEQYFGSFVLAALIVFIGLLFYLTIPERQECTKFAVKWVEQSSYRNMGTKQQQIVTVPAHWAEICTRREK